MKVRQGRPKNIQAALEIALELESYQLADRWGHLHSKGTTYARQVNFQNSSTNIKESSLKSENSVETEISKLGSLIGKVLEEVRQRGQNKRFDWQRLPRCYCCNELGHLQSSCPFNNTTGFQQQRQAYSITGFPQQRNTNTGFPQQRNTNTGFPQQRNTNTGFPQQRNTNTGFPQQRPANTGLPQQRQEDNTALPEQNSSVSLPGNFQRSSSRGRSRPL
jgi:hypothetical protein